MLNKDLLLSAVDNLFNSESGKKIESCAMDVIIKNGMEPYIKRGVVVGFSGGADSVLLLIFLRKLQKLWDFPLLAVHVNHSIRGNDSNDDERFAHDFASLLGVDFVSFTEDVPRIAEERSMCLEEAARDVRYEIFARTVSERSDINTVATAHNGTDNLETIIFNLMRGSGISGLSGISPIRDNVIRPLIDVAKEDITDLLDEAKIPYAVDKTNFSTEYSRNYIRHEIIPKLKRLNASPEAAASRASKNLREDAEFINTEAKLAFQKLYSDKKIRTEELKSLAPSVFSRIVCLMAKEITDLHPERTHIEKIRSLIATSDSFEVSLPGRISFVCRSGYSYVEFKSEAKRAEEIKEAVLTDGFNVIPDTDYAIGISSDKNNNSYLNVYKISIQANLSSAIIVGELSVRSKKDGDSYFYGGMTHKLKKLFNDRKIPPEQRAKVPIICDEKGIVWVPGFGVRDDGNKEKECKWITLYKK